VSTEEETPTLPARRPPRRFVPTISRSALRADARGISERTPSRSIARRESVYRRLLAVADVVSAAVAMVLSVQALGDDLLRWQSWLALPVVVAVLKIQGLYDRDGLLLNKTTLDEAPRLFQAATLYTLVFSVLQTTLITGRLGAEQTVGVWLILFASMVTGRTIVRRIARAVCEPERVIVLGGAEEMAQVETKIDENPSVNAVIVGRIPLEGARRENGTLGVMADLGGIVSEHRVHRAVVAPSDTTYDSTLDGIRAAKAVGVRVSVLPRLLEVVGSSVEFDSLYGVSLLGVRHFGLTKSSQFIKRGMDQVGAGLGLIVLSPVFATIAALVKFTSVGPMFFRQERIGKDGLPFQMLKFRTMIAGAEEMQDDLTAANEAPDGLFKIAEDPRVTRVGRFLRRTSLDELPQLLNVLRGQMSLVGPRPLVPAEDQRIEGRHRRRLHLKPGMTGHWQILGGSKIPLREMVTIDYLYVANWSLWGDVKILCRTVPHMLARRGL
jgi:exopolysaccharide biosynthesis polyprenyl glycosylphosphotransferase